MGRSSSPSLSINGIPPDILASFLARARREGWPSKNQVLIELMRMYGSGEINLGSTPPLMVDSNAARAARERGLPLHGKVIDPDGQPWTIWVQAFQDDLPNSSWLRARLLLQAIGSPPSTVTVIVTREKLVEMGDGNVDWILAALHGWLQNEERPPILNLQQT